MALSSQIGAESRRRRSAPGPPSAHGATSLYSTRESSLYRSGSGASLSAEQARLYRSADPHGSSIPSRRKEPTNPSPLSSARVESSLVFDNTSSERGRWQVRRTRSALSETHQNDVQAIVVEKGDEHDSSRQEWRQDSERSSASSTLSDIRPDGHRFNLQSRERSQLLLHVHHQSIKSQHHVQYVIDPDRGIHNNQS